MLGQTWKGNLAEFNSVQTTNSKLKMLGEEFKHSCHLKFGVSTTETKLVISQHQEHIEIIQKQSLKLDLPPDTHY